MNQSTIGWFAWLVADWLACLADWPVEPTLQSLGWRSHLKKGRQPGLRGVGSHFAIQWQPRSHFSSQWQPCSHFSSHTDNSLGTWPETTSLGIWPKTTGHLARQTRNNREVSVRHSGGRFPCLSPCGRTRLLHNPSALSDKSASTLRNSSRFQPSIVSQCDSHVVGIRDCLV